MSCILHIKGIERANWTGNPLSQSRFFLQASCRLDVNVRILYINVRLFHGHYARDSFVFIHIAALIDLFLISFFCSTPCRTFSKALIRRHIRRKQESSSRFRGLWRPPLRPASPHLALSFECSPAPTHHACSGRVASTKRYRSSVPPSGSPNPDGVASPGGLHQPLTTRH